MLVGPDIASETVFEAAEYDHGHLLVLTHPREQFVEAVLSVAHEILAVRDEQHAFLDFREILVQVAVESVPVGCVDLLGRASVGNLVAEEQRAQLVGQVDLSRAGGAGDHAVESRPRGAAGKLHEFGGMFAARREASEDGQNVVLGYEIRGFGQGG